MGISTTRPDGPATPMPERELCTPPGTAAVELPVRVRRRRSRSDGGVAERSIESGGRTMAPRRCHHCGRLVKGAHNCRRPSSSAARGYNAAWRRAVAEAIEAEPWCHWPGGCDHDDAGTEANPLTGDHPVPLAAGGAPLPNVIVVLCRRHNSAKGARLDPGDTSR